MMTFLTWLFGPGALWVGRTSIVVSGLVVVAVVLGQLYERRLGLRLPPDHPYVRGDRW